MGGGRDEMAETWSSVETDRPMRFIILFCLLSKSLIFFRIRLIYVNNILLCTCLLEKNTTFGVYSVFLITNNKVDNDNDDDAILPT